MDLALIDKTELSLVKENSLNEHQLAQILKRTPNQYIKKTSQRGWHMGLCNRWLRSQSIKFNVWMGLGF